MVSAIHDEQARYDVGFPGRHANSGVDLLFSCTSHHTARRVPLAPVLPSGPFSWQHKRISNRVLAANLFDSI